MRVVVPRRQLRVAGSFLAMIGLLGVILFSATQCQMVTDTLTGVDFSKGGSPGNCVASCAHEKNDAFKAEHDLNKASIEACNGDAGCLEQEKARHDAAVQAIHDAFFACKDKCHHQGAGSGG